MTSIGHRAAIVPNTVLKPTPAALPAREQFDPFDSNFGS